MLNRLVVVVDIDPVAHQLAVHHILEYGQVVVHVVTLELKLRFFARISDSQGETLWRDIKFRAYKIGAFLLLLLTLDSLFALHISSISLFNQDLSA